MSVVLAALDTTPAARLVLERAIQMGRLTGSRVEALHIRTGPMESLDTLELLAARGNVPFRVLEGPVKRALLSALSAPDVVAAVIGARSTTGGRRPVGRIALAIIEHLDKPVLVVPPEVEALGDFRCLLLPLEGTETSSRSVLEQLQPLLAEDAELVILHAFTDATVPAMLDRPHRDLEILGREFLTRHYPQASQIELRLGPVAPLVAEMSQAHGADLIVLSWSQDSSHGRARVVREVLGASALPVLLLPVKPLENEVAAMNSLPGGKILRGDNGKA